MLSSCGRLAATSKCDLVILNEICAFGGNMWLIKYASLLLILQLGRAEQQKPHIIVIVADDMVSLKPIIFIGLTQKSYY